MPNKKSRPGKLYALRQQGTLNPHPEAVTDGLFQGSEFFDARDLVQVKYEMLRRVEVEQDAISQAAAAFGFSRPSFYQAQSGFEQAGLAGLIPRKRGPRRAHKLTPEVMDFIRRSRAAQPSLRAEELAELVRERFGVRVHPRSIERRLSRQQKKRP
jgi:transposase